MYVKLIHNTTVVSSILINFTKFWALYLTNMGLVST